MGPLNCANDLGFIRCVVDGESLPGVLCPGQGDVCCPNPSRCCKDGNGCCATGEGGPLPLESFAKIVLGVVPMETPATEDMKGEERRRKRCVEFETRRERRRCVRLRRSKRRLCLRCRRIHKEGCDEICKKDAVRDQIMAGPFLRNHV